ncbi:hypothetical protein HK405_011705, partial [Cladochytrium tenue]
MLYSRLGDELIESGLKASTYFTKREENEETVDPASLRSLSESCVAIVVLSEMSLEATASDSPDTIDSVMNEWE